MQDKHNHITSEADQALSIPYDWYPAILPWNLVMDENVYIDTSWSFTSFHSKLPKAFKLGYGTGGYNRSIFMSGENGKIKIGKYVIVETSNFITNSSISVGDHCMFSWGSVVTDSWLDEESMSINGRRKLLESVAASPNRYLEFDRPRDVIIEDNVWVGFDAVIMPGVRLGEGSVIGCKTVITEDVPAYAVVVGAPPKIVKYLDAVNLEEERKKFIAQNVI